VIVPVRRFDVLYPTAAAGCCSLLLVQLVGAAQQPGDLLVRLGPHRPAAWLVWLLTVVLDHGRDGRKAPLENQVESDFVKVRSTAESENHREMGRLTGVLVIAHR
jgi:hypothetical protein